MLEVDDLAGKTFLDIGCGSGLFSLAARSLGATVFSFDYDPQSVACARELKNKFFPDDTLWKIEEGSVLEQEYMKHLGRFDVVYSWGVLHHTGNLMEALDNAKIPVSEDGILCIAIYNDQEFVSKFWTKVKKLYCSGWFGKCLITGIFVPLFTVQSLIAGLVKQGKLFGYFSNYKLKRGMSIYYDWIDWLGGYPFEVAKPEKIFLCYREENFKLKNLKTTNRLGCNEFVFQKISRKTS